MYNSVASFYGREIPEKYYDDVSKFFVKMMKKHCRPVYKDNNIVLDCGCGTGILTKKLAREGYDMIGLDASLEMLDIARENLEDNEQSILWVCQDMRKIDLFGTVAGVICTTDTVNHLTNEKDLNKFFCLVHNYVEPGGIFLFDILTEKYFENEIKNNVFFVDEENCTCIWQGKYNEKNKICKYEITVFETEDGENYLRSDDEVKEKAYGAEQIKEMLEAAGMEIIGIYGNTAGKIFDENSRRVYFLAKRT